MKGLSVEQQVELESLIAAKRQEALSEIESFWQRMVFRFKFYFIRKRILLKYKGEPAKRARVLETECRGQTIRVGDLWDMGFYAGIAKVSEIDVESHAPHVFIKYKSVEGNDYMNGTKLDSKFVEEFRKV